MADINSEVLFTLKVVQKGVKCDWCDMEDPIEIIVREDKEGDDK